MFLVLAGICLLLSVILSLLTYYCSYKYKGWRGVLDSFLHFLLILGILVFFCIFMLIYSIFAMAMDLPDFFEVVSLVGTLGYAAAMLWPFSTVIFKGIKERNSLQIEFGVMGELSVGAFLSFMVFFFCHAAGV